MAQEPLGGNRDEELRDLSQQLIARSLELCANSRVLKYAAASLRHDFRTPLERLRKAAKLTSR